MAPRPKAKSKLGNDELDKAEVQFEKFEEDIKKLDETRMEKREVKEVEPQTKIAQSDLEKMNDHYLKPERSISSKDKFNEKLRSEFEFAKEYVQFIAEHKEIIGETIEIWTRPFGGMPAEFWKVPTNKPVWGPRYLAEQIKRKTYRRLKMDESVQQSGKMAFYGQMVVDTDIARLTANPVSSKKSIFMGANNFN